MNVLVEMTEEQFNAVTKAGFNFEHVIHPIAYKIWEMEDIATVLKEEGYPATEDNISAVYNVYNGEFLQKLEECTDDDWAIIRNAVHETMDKESVINENRLKLQKMFNDAADNEEDELDFFMELLEHYTLTDIQVCLPEDYEYAKTFCEEHGLV